jgi:GNAT superfamily N-acetyltransferase
VSKLVVARSHAGRGIPLGILRFAESHARAIGHALLRLDCWDGNARLRAYYRDAGFAELESADEVGWRVRLFERAL